MRRPIYRCHQPTLEARLSTHTHTHSKGPFSLRAAACNTSRGAAGSNVAYTHNYVDECTKKMADKIDSEDALLLAYIAHLVRNLLTETATSDSDTGK